MPYDKKLVNDPSGGMPRLLEIMRALRDPETGCPWDIEQTSKTLSKYTLEEAYEVVEAIEKNNYSELEDELGDLLLQVVLFSQVSKDNNMFSFEEVCNEITKKIIRRHPQIFDVNYTQNDTPKDTWEKIKLKERQNKKDQFNIILLIKSIFNSKNMTF